MNELLKIRQYGYNILNNEKYKETMNKKHHGDITVLDHSIKVAVVALELVERRNIKNIDERSLVKICLLHDYFEHADLKNIHEKYLKFATHPLESSKRAVLEFGLTDKERNAIATHMFPISVELPLTREAYILTIADKIVSLEEKKYPFYRNIKKFVLKEKVGVEQKSIFPALNVSYARTRRKYEEE